MSLCKNCRHFYNLSGLPFTLAYGKCMLSRQDIPQKINPINGRIIPPKTKYYYADIERSNLGNCGIQGKLFEHETSIINKMRNLYKVPALTATKFIGTFAACTTVYLHLTTIWSVYIQNTPDIHIHTKWLLLNHARYTDKVLKKISR